MPYLLSFHLCLTHKKSQEDVSMLMNRNGECPSILQEAHFQEATLRIEQNNTALENSAERALFYHSEKPYFFR